MGAVYEAIDETFGEPIALKEIIIETADEKQKTSILKAFEREAKSLAKARHEAIPFVRDYFSELGRQFLVMELIEGKDLSEMLAARQTPFPVADALKWLDQLLDALDYLHNLNPPIIHRDIKPQNLKLNSRRKIKLLDFGIAKSTDADSTLAGQTFVGATLEYSPIEQLLRVINPTFREFILLKHKPEAEAILSQTTDVRCDIYALGATFYHLLTRQPPVDSTKRALEVWTGNPDPLRKLHELNPAVPPLISECLYKALKIERDRRFSTADEMRQALQAAIAGEENFSMGQKEASDYQKPSVAAPEQVPVTLLSLSAPSFSSTNLETIPDLKEISPDRSAAVSVETISSPASSATKKTKSSLILAFAALGILIVGGIGGVFWRNYSDAPVSNKSAANSANSAPTLLPSSTPIISLEAIPAPSPTQNIAETNPTPTPPAVPPNRKTPVRNSSGKRTIETPPRKPAQDPNCVFTNSCQ